MAAGFAAWLLFASTGVTQDALPLQVQADILQGQIEKDVAAGDIPRAIADIDRYRGMGVSVPAKLFFVEARLATISKDHVRAEQALREYLRVSSKADEDYAAAVAMFPDVQKAAADQKAANGESQVARPSTRPVLAAGGTLEGIWNIKMSAGRNGAKRSGTLKINEAQKSAVLNISFPNFPWPTEKIEQQCSLETTGTGSASVSCTSFKSLGLPGFPYMLDKLQISRVTDVIWRGSDSWGPVEITK